VAGPAYRYAGGRLTEEDWGKERCDDGGWQESRHDLPKSDSSYIVEFRTAAGESLAISVPRGKTAVLKHFEARMPYGLIVPDDPPGYRRLKMKPRRASHWRRASGPRLPQRKARNSSCTQTARIRIWLKFFI
jgi:hypothetical protein